jgi:hypothetical protein
MAENYLQHAEHYYRLIMAYQASVQPQQQHAGQPQQGGQPYGNNGSGQPQQGYNGGGQYRQPNGTGPQPGMEANGNLAQAGDGASTQDEPYREEETGRYD